MIDSLMKRYGPVEALRGVSVEVGAGEVFGLLGRNGAGKTTTVECAIGLRRPDAGRITVAGIDVLREPARAREKIGVQLQATALQDKITPRQALVLFAAFYPQPADVEELLARFQLTGKASAAFDTLSGGQRQRLALALALVNRPEVVFLDEPTAGLDAEAKRELHTMILDMRSAGRTVILTTHDIAEAGRLCDRIALIDRGEIVAAGKPDELVAAGRARPVVSVRTLQRLSDEQARSLSADGRAQWREDSWRIETDSVTRTLIGITQVVAQQGNELLDVQIHRPSLEDVFLELLAVRDAAFAANPSRENPSRDREGATHRQPGGNP